MGGAVGLTIRTPDGTEHRMSRWTNILSWVVCNLDFFTKNPGHIEDILSPWYEMRADFLENQGTRKFHFPMTASYGGHALLAPTDYGLVVLDMVNDRILTMQGYTSFHHVIPFFTDNPDDKERVQALYVAGRMTDMRVYGKGALPLPETWEKILELLGDWARCRDVHAFTLNTAPFVIERFEQSPEGSAALKARVLELGFALTEEEEAVWTEFNSRWAEDEE